MGSTRAHTYRSSHSEAAANFQNAAATGSAVVGGYDGRSGVRDGTVQGY